MEILNKLQSLCNASNRRYENKQNTDDQDKRVFNFANKNPEVCVLIGYTDYQAVKAEEVINFYKQNPGAEIKKENDFCFIKMNYKTARIKASLLD